MATRLNGAIDVAIRDSGPGRAPLKPTKPTKPTKAEIAGQRGGNAREAAVLARE